MVKNGLDRIEDYDSCLRGRRLGLITSVSGVTTDLKSAVDVLSKRYRVTALFGPEHGVRGEGGAGEAVEDEVDPHTGIPVYSLYQKESRQISKEQLKEVDALVYDIQDVGARYYTYISTLFGLMRSCELSQKELVVLDRLNPLGGRIEGNLLSSGCESFIGCYPICMRYGMTVGELSRMIYAEQQFSFPITIVPALGWRRHMLFPATGNLWMPPSPGMPHFETALVYPGTCLFEGTNVSEGRGTSLPFEMIGAPYVDGYRLSKEMNGKKLPGVLFTPAYFTPTASKYRGEHCEGVQLHVTDPESFCPVKTALTLLFAVKERYDKFSFLPPSSEGEKSTIELLYGNGEILREDVALPELLEACDRDSEAFARRIRPYLMYD